MSEVLTIREVCPTATQVHIRHGATLVDVRERHEVAALAFDVPGLIHIPLSEFEDRYEELPRDKKLVIVCEVGSRSLRAAGYLIYHGWDADKVLNMKRGMVRWAQKGYPVIGDPTSLMRNESGSCGCHSHQETANADSGACCGSKGDASTEACS